jgi:hypothetical protein
VIQSTESSNRIEGITVAPERLKEILNDNEQPRDRPEAQLLGYHNVLAEIHTNYRSIEITTDAILFLKTYLNVFILFRSLSDRPVFEI